MAVNIFLREFRIWNNLQKDYIRSLKIKTEMEVVNSNGSCGISQYDTQYDTLI